VSTDNNLPDPGPILELLTAFRRSKTMFCAVSLGVFDSLAAGPKSLTEIANELQASPDGIERLLDACVGLKLLAKRNDAYSCPPESTAFLTRNSPHRLTGYIDYSNNVMWKLWANLEDAVREGTHRWHQAFGWEGPIFSHFFHTQAAHDEFLMGMHGYGLISSPQVVAAFDLSQYGHLVDLGGATGHLAIAACERYPKLRATVFDLAGTEPLARAVLRASAFADRIHFESGDFFTDPLPEGDLYALGRILHDWTVAKILVLLSRVHAALPPSGAVLIAEKLLWDDKTGPAGALMQNLNMLTCTEGKERTLGEYEALLTRAGFLDVRGYPSDSPLDAVIARKP
jgi:acetylserotonin N-methyltransferase